MPWGAFKKILSGQGISSPGKNSKTYKWKNTYEQWIFQKFVLVKQILSPENFEKNSKWKGALIHWICFSPTKCFTLWKLYSGFVLYDFCFALFRWIGVLQHLD